MLWSCHVTVNDEQRPVDLAAVDGVDHFLRETAVPFEQDIEVEQKAVVTTDELAHEFTEASLAQVVYVRELPCSADI